MLTHAVDGVNKNPVGIGVVGESGYKLIFFGCIDKFVWVRCQ